MGSSEIFEGGCQCRQANYRVIGESIAYFVCHCTECQRQSASAFGMALWIRSFRTQVLDGDLGTWVRTTPTGRQMVCRFCVRCGTRMFHQMTDQSDTISIKPGTLDGALRFEPVAHIWTSSAKEWVHVPPTVLSYPENPPRFDEMFTAWRLQKRAAYSASGSA